MHKVHQTREERASDYNDDIPVVTDSSLFHLTGITQVQPFKWSIASSYEWKSIQALLVTEVVAGQGAKCLQGQTFFLFRRANSCVGLC